MSTDTITPAQADEDRQRLERLGNPERTTATVLATLAERLPALWTGRRTVTLQVQFVPSGRVVVNVHGYALDDDTAPVAALAAEVGATGHTSTAYSGTQFLTWTTPNGTKPSVRITAYLPEAPAAKCCECGK